MSGVPDSNRPTADPSSGTRLVQGQEVSLGCGTLILIALIVMIFGRTKTGDLENEVRRLRSDVSELTKTVEAQTEQIKALREKLDPAN